MSEWDLPQNVEKQSNERIGGGGYIWKSGVHKATIKMVYMNQAKSGAVSFNIVMENAEGQTMKEAMYIRSGKAKGNKTFYEKEGKAYPLPGYASAESLCIAAVGKQLPEVLDAVEKKTVKIYDFDAGKEMPQERPVPMELINTAITVAVVEQLEDKNKKDSSGNYVPTGETRQTNASRFFGNADGFTAEEITAKAEEATKFDAWAEKNAGKVVDKTTAGKSGKATTTATPAATPSASSMFS